MLQGSLARRSGMAFSLMSAIFAGEALGYCGSNGSNASYEWISSVGVDAFSNTSASNGGYFDFTSKVIELSAGPHGIVLKPGFKGSTYLEYWKVWIDFNGDQQYAEDEAVYSGQSYGALSGTFTVPETANAGLTGMRVSMRYGAAPTPCGSFSYGEVEDYTANLVIADTNPPTVASRSPAASAVDVPVSSVVTVVFSEAVDPLSVTDGAIFMESASGAVAGAVSLSGKVATFTPQQPLTHSTTYTVTVRAGVQDLSGNPMVQNDTWSFSTAAPDFTAPTVSGVSPANNATNVQSNAVLEAYFSEAMDPATITAETFTVSSGGLPVTGSVVLTGGGKTAQFTPAAPYGYSKTLTAMLTNGVKDLAGNAMEGDYVWTFTTLATPPTYCASYATNYTYMWPSSVKLDTYTYSWANNPGTGYVNMTSSTHFSLSRFFSRAVTLKPAFAYSYDTVYWRVFIDWNQDGVFGADETAFSGYGTGTVTGDIAVPQAAPGGTTRMRVSARIPTYAPSCGSFTYGRVIDFNVVVPPN